ncbi:MAG: hypothetical protein HZA35_01290 [Parcubacteria group bacterium]|nr:hypothetical protein [Parcubacteria group bacterium]
MKKNSYLVFLVLIISIPRLVLAFEPPPPPPGFVETASQSTLTNIVNGVVGFLATLFLAGSLVAMFYAGYLFLSSGGEVEKITTARRNLIWGLVGLLVGLSAYVAPELIKIFLQQ